MIEHGKSFSKFFSNIKCKRDLSETKAYLSNKIDVSSIWWNCGGNGECFGFYRESGLRSITAKLYNDLNIIQ
jgi:hypothetical protein